MRRLSVLSTCVARASRALSTSARRSAASESTADLKKTALHDLHMELGGRMVPFAGYAMPVVYKDHTLAETHHHVRSKAGLFDVSHMGQLKVCGGEDNADAITFMEQLVPGNVRILKPGGCRLTCLTNEDGGIIDDCMITRLENHLYVVVNAACFDKDLSHFESMLDLEANADLEVGVEHMKHHSLLALQGPTAKHVLASLMGPQEGVPADDVLKTFAFMTGRGMTLNGDAVAGLECHVTRCGYTGEDGFEISVHDDQAPDLARAMLAHPDVLPVGLGARDTLRLEAGLCLYGNDIDDTTTLAEADLAWFAGKRRRRDGGFLGADTILPEIADPALVKRKRVGLIVGKGAPARAGTAVFSDDGTTEIGVVTSGCPSPTLGKNIAMAYVPPALAKPGTSVTVKGRRKLQEATVTALPFVQSNYYRVPK